VKGTQREDSLAGDPERHVERAPEMGISFHRSSALGNLEKGSFTGEFKMWTEGGLWERGNSFSSYCYTVILK
jgi:hypothetical protein